MENKIDLQTIVLHERTHIRLGHLWIFFLWDVLCSLLWVNPFLHLPDGTPKDELYRILWGGFLKVPGIGGAMNAVYFDTPLDGNAVSVEFFDVNDLLYIKLIKLL